MSTMLNRLLDIGLNVDTSGLESFLSQIRDRLDGLQDRIADLENDSGMTEDTVQDLIDSSLSNTDYVDRSDVENMIDNKAYDAVSDQVYDMVKDVVREDLDEKDFADRDHDHTGEYATTDSVDELEGRVSTLESTVDAFADHEGRVEALEQRLGVYANKADNAALNMGEWRAEDLAALGQRIERLETDTHSDNEAIIALTQEVQALRAQVGELETSSSASTRFFKLAVQMLDIVRESVGR